MIVIDMEMPESCYDCEAFGSSFCFLWDKHRSFSDQRTKRHKDCPIVGEIKVHNDGMVIAADLTTVIDGTDEAPYKLAIVALDNAPTALEETGNRMQIVIELSEAFYAKLPEIQNGSIAAKSLINIVKNGIVLAPHGRLVDADIFIQNLVELSKDTHKTLGECINDLPTILEGTNETS